MIDYPATTSKLDAHLALRRIDNSDVGRIDRMIAEVETWARGRRGEWCFRGETTAHQSIRLLVALWEDFKDRNALF